MAEAGHSQWIPPPAGALRRCILPCTSASTACSRSARAPLRKTSVSGSAKSFWLGELENVSVGLGVSLLQWRSGGFEHPQDTPPYPLMPSPTFAHSSSLVGWLTNEASASGPIIANTHADDSPVRHCSSVRSNRNRVGFLPAATFRCQVDAVPVRSRRDRLVRRNRARCARHCPFSPQPQLPLPATLFS